MNFGPCQARIKYDGPIFNIFLFAPGVNVISGSPVSSNTTNVNPKDITASLTNVGLWNIVIHHGLISAMTLTPFSVVVETQEGVNECINFCSNIPYTEGLLPTFTNRCRCQDGFNWNSVNSTCEIDCSAFNQSGNVGLKVGGSIDICSCLESDQSWNTTYLGCIIDCSNVTNSLGLDTNNFTNC